MNVRVVGAGVVGLTTAIVLLERGHAVDVIARERTPNTTSDVAAAIYFPYLVEPRELVGPWCKVSLERFRRFQGISGAAVEWRDAAIGIEGTGPPWWRELVDAARPTAPIGGHPAWACRVPIITMPRYMQWLEGRVAKLGGQLASRTISSLASAASGVDAVVNCTGLGARELCDDDRLVPVRGQIVRVEDNGVPRAITIEEPLCYVVPRPDGVIIGGTADRGDSNLEPDDATERLLLDHARRVSPGLGRVLGRAVGLRPSRPRVRLERETLAGGATVIHNYGHGGAGVTLSWGCAESVAGLVGALR